MKKAIVPFLLLILMAITFSIYSCGSSGSSSDPTTPTYSWQTGSWGVCSNDTQSRTVTCKSSTGTTVADSYCTEAKPATTQSCTSTTVTYSWETGIWGTCTSYTQTRTVICKGSDGSTGTEDNCSGAKLLATQSCEKGLNDTGITKFGNASSNSLTSEPSDFPGQDGSYGRDVTNNDNSDGNAGFSFTKISSTGSKLPSSYANWSCVQDNVTGLMWEVKTDDSGLQDKDNTYTWYNPDSTKNGGSAGTQNGGTCPGGINCDTYSYVNKINTDGLCGYKDWRVPKQGELISIVDYSRYEPSIDTAYFPNTINSYYWSSSPYSGRSNDAWELNFNYGYVGHVYESKARYVRLVRLGQ